MPIQLRISQSHPALLPLLVALLLPLLIAILSCGSPNGKPSTAAPNIPGDSADFWDACEERKQAIDAWLERQERKFTEDWLDDKRGFLQSAVKVEQVQEEARAMKDALHDNCDAKWRQTLPPSLQ